MRRVTGIGGGRLHARRFLEANMKTILSVALVFGLCGLARARDAGDARDAQADPVGTWKCEYGIEGQKRTSTLTIKMDGDKLAGTMSWPDQKDEPLKDVKLKDGTLTFDAKRLLMGKEFANHYELKIDGDKLKGKLTSDLQGQKYDFDLEATRQKKDK
jgi:hypothetical protein